MWLDAARPPNRSVGRGRTRARLFGGPPSLDGEVVARCVLLAGGELGCTDAARFNRENRNKKKTMFYGTLHYWNDAGYGFLRRDDKMGDVYVHVSEFKDARLPEPRPGDRFRFEILDQRKGASKAVRLERAS